MIPPSDQHTPVSESPRAGVVESAQPGVDNLPLWWKIAGTLLLVGLLLSGATSSYYYHTFLFSTFFAFSMACSLILLIRVGPSAQEVVSVLALTCALATLDYAVLQFRLSISGLISLLGLSSLMVLGLRMIWTRKQRRILHYAFWPALLMALSAGATSWTLDRTTLWHPKTLDLYLYSFDCSLGIQISFFVGIWFVRWIWLARLTEWIYGGVALPLGLVYAMQLKHQQRARTSIIAFLVAGPVGALFYNFIPATGPIHVFPNFPSIPISTALVARLALEPIAVSGPRNAIPSLHTAWVLLAFWNSRHAPFWARAIAFLFLAFTVFATLGMGEHYFVDLVVAFPFALMIQAIASIRWSGFQPQWRLPFISGLVGTLAWLALLRFATRLMWVSPALPWTLIGATIAASLFLYLKLQHSVEAVAA